MKKVMSVLAVALFSVGVYSYNEYSSVNKVQLDIQNMDNAIATDGTVNPKDKRTFTDGTVNPKDKRTFTDGTVNPKDKRT